MRFCQNFIHHHMVVILGGQKISQKVLQSGFFFFFFFFWPTLFKDCHKFVQSCDRCQRVGNISRWNEMPPNNILEVEIFGVWGMGFMGPFPSSFGNLYVLLAVDYV